MNFADEDRIDSTVKGATVTDINEYKKRAEENASGAFASYMTPNMSSAIKLFAVIAVILLVLRLARG